MKRILILLFLVISPVDSFAQLSADTLARIDKIFDRYLPQNPGCQLSISRNGSVIFSKAWGMADLEHTIPLTTESITEAGSVSKQFTAAAVLLLEQQGKLSLDDDIRKYIPEIPDYGTPITLRRMMHHASGFRDWGSVAGIAGWPRTTKTYSNDDALDIIIHQKALNHKPGDEFLYSNSNYNLFAILVERVSGLSLADYTKNYLFEPAGMTHTQWRDDFRRIVPNRAIAYEKTATGYETDMPNEYVYGNGGLLTTTEDLLKWNEYYWNGHFGSPSLLPKQLTIEVFNNGTTYPYAAGLYVTKNKGQDYVYHTGSTAGYRALLIRYPQEKLSIAWLSNTSQFDATSNNVVKEIENLFVADRSDKNAASKSESATSTMAKNSNSVKPNSLQDYIGTYYSEEAQATFSLKESGGKLILNQAPGVNLDLVATGQDTFKAAASSRGLGGAVITFQRDKKSVKGFNVTIPRARNVSFKKQ
ncbi:serine hydrolase domain-containing protein [Spirosoma terrae]|uniref:Beta-lactamase family protein n=1 Tax=Spirosoma terrae TaxID=1968276 RepID=A0A6L9LGC9_9BACT|nr:serine hydrolase domain-containing protein [Spirosoma terrae]NDU98727.1 beta-lactamase family protein [Spirosoma terrae]